MWINKQLILIKIKKSINRIPVITIKKIQILKNAIKLIIKIKYELILIIKNRNFLNYK